MYLDDCFRVLEESKIILVNGGGDYYYWVKYVKGYYVYFYDEL